ncbi:MAG: prepilin-type N-terminal cleavage/methylation domain-containing protein [Elusimicrobiales bacterium]
MKKGFTLIEVIVVVLIIAVLSALAATQLFRAVESSRMSDAVALVSAVSGARKMARLDYIGGTLPSGKLASLTAVKSCSGSWNSIDDYTNCKYLSPHDWNSLLYSYYMCNDATGAGGGCCAANVVACAQRKTTSEDSKHGTSGDFATWRVQLMSNGKCVTSCKGNCSYAPPDCPSM